MDFRAPNQPPAPRGLKNKKSHMRENSFKDIAGEDNTVEPMSNNSSLMKYKGLVNTQTAESISKSDQNLITSNSQIKSETEMQDGNNFR